jgi:nucleoside-diphosphate-sugar epimerase
MKVILTGATGMVGEGILLECLQDGRVTTVLSVSRSPCGRAHPKLKELLIEDFTDIGSYPDQLQGFDACFYCLGISSVGLTEADYHHITYDLTTRFAETVLKANSGMTFIFLSGANTDASEKGKVMWARVKGKTENALGRMPFHDQYNFRPSLMKPGKDQVHLKGYNKYLGMLYPLLDLFYTGCTLSEVGRAMINAAVSGYPKKTLEAADIKALAAKI